MEDDEDCNIRVICRFRPVNKREIAEGGGLATQLTFPTDKTVEVSAWNGRAAQTFNFDKVFYDPSTTQEDIYELAAKKSIEDVIKGYNSTIFAYGQTGAGKSFTMFGPDILVPDLKGIIPRSCMHIFQHIANDREGTEYTIKCSFLEIYKENVRDLLNPSHENKPGGLRIREAPGKGVWVEGLHEAYVASEEDVLELIKAGERNRAVSSTAMNAVSSRSHSLFILTLHQKTRDGSTKEGKLNLADLAGSEKVGKTGATGETLEEAKKINQSLSALGNCINALTKSKKAHVPYRDSKLTFILRESLGGNCKTTLLIACSPHVFNLEETISTLMFGKRAKTIKNSVKVNKQRSVAELMAIIEKLKKEISGFKRYISILEQELEKVKGPNWRDDLPKTARPAPPPTAEEEPSRRTASSDDTGESGDSELSDGGDSLVSKSQPNLSAPRENAQTPSNNRSHHQRNSSVQGGDDEYDQVFTSTANMSLKLAELQVELQNVREKLQLEIDDLTEEKKSLTTDLESKSKKLSLKKELVKEKESQLKALRAELDAQHQAKAQLEEKLTYEIKQLQITTEDQNKSMELISSHNAELRLKSQTLSQELEDLQENNARLQTEHDRLKREISELVSAEQRKQTRIQELESNLAEYESEYKNMRNLQLQLELTNKTLTSKLETATGKSESLAAHSKEIESKLKVASADKQALESHVQNLNAKIIELEADLEELRSARLQRQAENEQLEELRASFVEKAEFERISKEREKLKAQLAQANSQAQEERDLVHSLKDQLEKAQEAHLEQLEQSKAEYEASLERLTSSVQLLEASLAEEQQVNSKKFRTLEEKSQDLASQCELEKQARSRAEQALLEQSELLAAKEKLLRRAMSSSDDKDRELTQQTSLVQSQARTLAAQEERIKKLELELEERTKERELLQQEIKTALEINIENAKQFEQQLTVAREETQLRPQNIRVPISNNERGFLSSIFGGRQLPVLGEIKTPVKFGYLLKRSNWLKVWEKRWFVLTEKNLFYYETNNLAAKAAGEIEIDGCKVAPAAEFLGRPNTFGILHKSRKEFYLQASSEEDCMDWMRCIHNSIHGKAPTKAARPTSVIIPRGSQSASNVTMIPPS